MRVCVLGLWHLGSVTAACTAAAGHEVVGWDPDPVTVEHLSKGVPPVAEPGLTELIAAQVAAGRLSFVADLERAVRAAEVVWVTFDTPVDADDQADVEAVIARVRESFPHLAPGALVLVSSQLPVGSVARLEAEWSKRREDKRVSFAASPENLRLGKAIEAFSRADRVVIGVRSAPDRARLEKLFGPITATIEWMSVESAEMTKHALNAFLALSVAFANELAGLCEREGADAREVERGLKSEPRIGRRAYLSPGGAFAGGTLARDVAYLQGIGQRHARSTPLMDGIVVSNASHRLWPEQRLRAELGSLERRRVAIWGLTYKPGTDTLRRSLAVELCRTLAAAGSEVRVHDPAATALPADLNPMTRVESPLDAARGADALVVATEWPDYRAVDADRLAEAMPSGLVIDANRFLGPLLGTDARFRLISVGTPGVRS